MEDEIAMRLRERYNQIKNLEHLTQEKIAEHCGVEQVTVSRWMRGRNRPDSLERYEQLAEILQTTPEWLMFGIQKTPDAEKITATSVIYEQLPDDLKRLLLSIATVLLEHSITRTQKR